MVSDWHKNKTTTPKFTLESRLSITDQNKTLSMQRDHLVYSWKKEIEDLRSNAKVSGERTRKYYEACADSLERALDAALKEMYTLIYQNIE